MFDFLRDRGATAEEKSREALSAYLDNALTPAERERLERRLAREADLRAELEQMRLLKRQMSAMPRRRVPRSFALDPALYGRPKAQPAMQLYPVLRGATALAAFLLIFVFALGAFQGQFGGGDAAPAAEVSILTEAAVEEAAGSDAAAGETERVAPTGAPEMEAAAEAPAAELAAPEIITEGLSLAEQPPVGGAAPEAYPDAAALPQTDLSFEATAPAAEATQVAIAPTEEEAAAEAAETPVASAGLPTDETANVVAQEQATDTDAAISPLQWLQIGLGIAFLLLLILWLLVRRRVRSL